MQIHSKHCLAAFAALTLGIGTASADTILASADARAEFGTSPVNAEDANGFRLGVGPVDGSNRSFRSYLTFDLTSETAATTVTVNLFDASANESNDTGFTQNLTLFEVASDYEGGVPNGTDLASNEVTFAAQPSQDLSFSSAALTAAFNNAVGGTLYLGLYSPEGEVATAGTRSFLWLSSLESSIDADPAGGDSGARPSLTYTPVPEPGSLALLGLGGLLIARRRRG